MTALVLHWAATGYASEAPSSAGLLFPWGILSVGMAGSARYRYALPKTTNARLPIFFSENPDLRTAIPSILHAWRDPFWLGLRYGASKGILYVNGPHLSAHKTRLKPRNNFGAELEAVARRLGRLIAREGDDSRIAAVLGTGFSL